MTVDSKYAIAQYNEDGEVTYRFFTESIGDEAMQVWKVSAAGARTQLASNEYSITYDLSQTPTFIGGTITLVTPLAEGEKLSVERKTPIINDLTLTSLTPFPSEEFEYMMDKICFIQQEIEGSYCDCRGVCVPAHITVQPVDSLPSEPAIPDCEAFETAVVQSSASAIYPMNDQQSISGSEQTNINFIRSPSTNFRGRSIDTSRAGLLTECSPSFAFSGGAGGGAGGCIGTGFNFSGAAQFSGALGANVRFLSGDGATVLQMVRDSSNFIQTSVQLMSRSGGRGLDIVLDGLNSVQRVELDNVTPGYNVPFHLLYWQDWEAAAYRVYVNFVLVDSGTINDTALDRTPISEVQSGWGNNDNYDYNWLQVWSVPPSDAEINSLKTAWERNV